MLTLQHGAEAGEPVGPLPPDQHLCATGTAGQTGRAVWPNTHSGVWRHFASRHAAELGPETHTHTLPEGCLRRSLALRSDRAHPKTYSKAAAECCAVLFVCVDAPAACPHAHVLRHSALGDGRACPLWICQPLWRRAPLPAHTAFVLVGHHLTDMPSCNLVTHICKQSTC